MCLEPDHGAVNISGLGFWESCGVLRPCGKNWEWAVRHSRTQLPVRPVLIICWEMLLASTADPKKKTTESFRLGCARLRKSRTPIYSELPAWSCQTPCLTCGKVFFQLLRNTNRHKTQTHFLEENRLGSIGIVLGQSSNARSLQQNSGRVYKKLCSTWIERTYFRGIKHCRLVPEWKHHNKGALDKGMTTLKYCIKGPSSMSSRDDTILLNPFLCVLNEAPSTLCSHAHWFKKPMTIWGAIYAHKHHGPEGHA